MESLIHDIRSGTRSLSSSPGFVLLSVVCLGIGIGANTTVFSVVNGVLLQPLPFVESNRLIALNEIRRENPLDVEPVSYPTFRDWQEQGAAIAEMAAMRPRSVTVSDAQHTDRQSGALVTWNFFPLLGIQPIVGRGFRQDDDRAGAASVVLLSEVLWQERYAGNHAAIGQSVIVNGRPHTIVGIVPRFAHSGLPGSLRAARIWIPLTPIEHQSRRDQRSMAVYARLAAGVRLDLAATRLAAIAQTLETDHIENQGWGVGVQPLAIPLSPTNRAMIVLMIGAVSFVLLIACANAANLTLARATSRRREMAIRIALGASRGRILRQLLTESLIVGVLSAPVGLVLASWSVDLLRRAAAEQANNIVLAIDGRVLAFTMGLAILTSLLFGLAPALHAIQDAPRDALIETGRASTVGRSQKHLRNLLVVGEVALSLILLVVASLFVRSFMNLLQEDGSFDTSRIMSLRFEMPEHRYDSPDSIVRRVEDVVARIGALPGVESVAASNLTPLRGGGNRSTAILEGTGNTTAETVTILYGGVTSRFFETLNVPLVHGRSFTDGEARTRSAVAIVNRRMADRLWPDQDVLGNDSAWPPTERRLVHRHRYLARYLQLGSQQSADAERLRAVRTRRSCRPPRDDSGDRRSRADCRPGARGHSCCGCRPAGVRGAVDGGGTSPFLLAAGTPRSTFDDFRCYRHAAGRGRCLRRFVVRRFHSGLARSGFGWRSEPSAGMSCDSSYGRAWR